MIRGGTLTGADYSLVLAGNFHAYSLPLCTWGTVTGVSTYSANGAGYTGDHHRPVHAVTRVPHYVVLNYLRCTLRDEELSN